MIVTAPAPSLCAREISVRVSKLFLPQSTGESVKKEKDFFKVLIKMIMISTTLVIYQHGCSLNLEMQIFIEFKCKAKI